MAKLRAHTDTLHTQGRRVLDVLNRWQEDFLAFDSDCATVSSYYSGKIMETPEDQDTLGLVDHSNYKVGAAGLVKAKEETLSSFTKPHRLARIKFLETPDDLTPIEKKGQEQKLEKVIDQLLRDWDLVFADEFSQMVDRHVMHGDAIMIFPPEDEGWRPFSAKILTDHDAPQNVHDDNFTRWAVYADLQIGEALTGIANEAEGWMPSAEKFIRSLWERRYDAVDVVDSVGPSTPYVSTYDDMLSLVEYVSPEEWAAQGEVGANLHEGGGR